MRLRTRRQRMVASALTLAGLAAALATVTATANAEVTPLTNSLTVQAGAAATTSVTVSVAGNGSTGGGTLPTAVDVEIAIDTTGSMSTGIAQAKADAANLVTQMRALIPDAQFSVVQFRDDGDIPLYQVEQSMTADGALITDALGRLVAGGGGDSPEAHNLVFHNAAVPAVGGSIGWRGVDVPKYVVVISDAQPHGAGTAGISGCDDLTPDPLGYTTPETLAELRAAGRSLFMVFETNSAISTNLSCYQFLALAVGGNSRGFTGGTDFATQLVPLISGTSSTVGQVTVQVANTNAGATFADWVKATPVGPALTPATLPVTLTVSPPSSAAAGTYLFDLVAFADGLDVGHATLTVTVTASDVVVTPVTSVPAGGGGGGGGGSGGGGGGGTTPVTTVPAGTTSICTALAPPAGAIVGTAGKDRLVGTAGNDVIWGLGSVDVIDGGAGDDVICGGDGDDTITGGTGNDQLGGGAGRDKLSGGLGDEVFSGGADSDECAGDGGAAVFVSCEKSRL